MKQILIFLKKEFIHILRDPRSMLVLLGMPVAQIVLFGFAITNEIRNANIAILDNAKDQASHNIIARIQSSKYFIVDKNLTNNNQLTAAFRAGKIKLALVIPPSFSTDLQREKTATIQLIADGTDPNTATTLINYVTSIIMDYQMEQRGASGQQLQIATESRMLYNPQLKGVYSSVPGVMALILILISAMMTSIAIVKEFEMGTMEVLLVSPVKPWLIVICKTIPYFFLSFVNVATIIVLSIFVLGLPINGSIFLLFLASFLYILCALSIGLLISTSTKTQQAAMLVSLVGLMLPLIMLSGYMFPIANMPFILQILGHLTPATYYIIIVKAIMIKGLGLAGIWKESLVIIAMTLFFIGLSIKRFKTRLS